MKLILNKIILMALFLWGFYSVNAQSERIMGNWDVFVLKGFIGPKFFYNGEFNMRTNDFPNTYDYSEYKILFGYHLTQDFGIDVGTGGYNSSLTGSFLTTQPSRKEIRTWVDFLLKHSYNRFYFDHRIRIERRYTISSGSPYRIRYRPVLTITINKPRLKDNTFFLSTSDDAFFGQFQPTLELNMFYLGAGYRLNDHFTFQAGNMNNYDFRKSTNQSRNYLYLTFVYNLTARSSDKEL
jgi:hypothetical protein